MAKNIDAFSVYTAKVLDSLFDSFPIPTDLRCKDFVDSPDVTAWLKRIGTAATEATDSGDPFARMDAAALESDKLSAAVREHQHLEAVFAGTMRFLLAEGFIHSDPECSDWFHYASCQLTGKGLLHLNREFKDKQLTETGGSIIDAIKRRFSSSSSIEGATVTQVFVGLVTKLLVG